MVCTLATIRIFSARGYGVEQWMFNGGGEGMKPIRCKHWKEYAQQCTFSQGQEAILGCNGYRDTCVCYKPKGREDAEKEV